MITDNDNTKHASADPSYGGSKYRLSYDSIFKKKKDKKSASSRTRSMIVAAVIIAAFVAFTVLVLEYYDDVVKSIYGNESTTTENLGEADFQSSINIVID